MPRILAIIPHPDDESYSFGGLIRLAASAGWECFIECASYGEKGKRHDGGPTRPNDVAEVREDELASSCTVLGAREPVFWGLPDGEMRLHKGEHERIRRLFATVRPDVVLTLGRDGAYGHPDHTALHRWVFETWSGLPPRERPALLFPVFPKGLFLPQYEKCIRMMGEPPNPPREAVGSDISHYQLGIEPVAPAKLAAIAAHSSQLPGGEPGAIFPPGIVSALLDTERFEDATGKPQPRITRLLATLSGN